MAQLKTYREIDNEIREVLKRTGDQPGSLSGMTWVRMIPVFLLRTFVRIADHNLRIAERYGKVCVIAVGMFNKDSVWFIPHGTATVVITVGGISEEVIQLENKNCCKIWKSVH
jgi:hypothetical protein